MRSILVIRKHTHVGDMLCSLSMSVALREEWPHCRITLLAAPASYLVPLAEIHPYLGEIILNEKRSLTYILRLHLRLLRACFDPVVLSSTISLS